MNSPIRPCASRCWTTIGRAWCVLACLVALGSMTWAAQTPAGPAASEVFGAAAPALPASATVPAPALRQLGVSEWEQACSTLLIDEAQEILTLSGRPGGAALQARDRAMVERLTEEARLLQGAPVAGREVDPDREGTDPWLAGRVLLDDLLGVPPDPRRLDIVRQRCDLLVEARRKRAGREPLFMPGLGESSVPG